MKRILQILGCLAASIAIVVFLPGLMPSVSGGNENASAEEESILPQWVESINSSPSEIYRIYSSGQLIGVLKNRSKLNALLDSIYEEEYAEEFPGSEAALGKDVYLVSEQSYFTYTDIDDDICNYLKENNLFTLKAAQVEFSDSNGIYAKIYVGNQSMYEAAMNTYLSYFISSSDLALLNSGQSVPELRDYGSRATSVSISQTITVRESYAPASEILNTEADILEYLEYGNDTEKEYYTVQKYDTVAGVGAKNHGLSATQVMNINRDKISSTDQVLSEGEQLCVTYFNSPIDIVVNQESMRKEVVYFETVYQEDPDLKEGEVETTQAGSNGSRNSLYSEKWINGVLVSGSLVSYVDTLQPVNEVVSIGTMQIPGVGTGQFRWPVDNPSITCHWGCYYGHRAIDIQNAYDHYGNIYAADRGVISENSYNSINGNYVIINHNNGYYTYYGHMNVPSPLAVGTIVDKGDVIGQIGMTGVAAGPHTHFFIFSLTQNADGTTTAERYDPCSLSNFPSCDGV